MTIIDYLKELTGTQLESIVNANGEHEFIIFDVSIFNAGAVINLIFTNDLSYLTSDEFEEQYGCDSFVANTMDCIRLIEKHKLFDRFQIVIKIDEQARETIFYYRNDETPTYNLVTTILQDHFNFPSPLAVINITHRRMVEDSIHEGKAHLVYAAENANIHYITRKAA